MQPATIRRLLVFGVCLAGVGCLYLLPSMAGSDLRVGSAPARNDQPTAQPTTTAIVSTTTLAPSIPDAGSSASTNLVRMATRSVGDTGNTHLRPGSTPTRTAGTAVQPGRDDSEPGPVGRLRVTTYDAERLTISWPEATDDVGVVAYTVWLNGFAVLTTQQTRATLAWFNDTNSHVIQVRAQDAAGNEGPTSPTLLVARPTPTVTTSTQTPPPAPSTPVTKPSPTPSEAGGEAPDAHTVPSPAKSAESGAEGSNS